MSWVFLTTRHVYKLRKPVRTDYLGILTLTLEPEEVLKLAGSGRVVEMQRLPNHRMLDRCISQGTLKPQEVNDVIGVLVKFYRDAPRTQWRSRPIGNVTGRRSRPTTTSSMKPAS